jgi:biopolymer transport protein ExbB
VLAYNYLQARNKGISEQLTGFSTDVLANIASGGAVKPATIAPARAAPVAAAKPATAPTKP